LGENERSILLDQPLEKPCNHAAPNLEASPGMTSERFRPPDPGTYCTESSYMQARSRGVLRVAFLASPGQDAKTWVWSLPGRRLVGGRGINPSIPAGTDAKAG
jgi:hypothetical protein